MWLYEHLFYDYYYVLYLKVRTYESHSPEDNAVKQNKKDASGWTLFSGECANYLAFYSEWLILLMSMFCGWS